MDYPTLKWSHSFSLKLKKMQIFLLASNELVNKRISKLTPDIPIVEQKTQDYTQEVYSPHRERNRLTPLQFRAELTRLK